MGRFISLLIPFLLTGCLRGCGAPMVILDGGRQAPVVENEAVKQGETRGSSSASSEEAEKIPAEVGAEEVSAPSSFLEKREPEFIPQALSWALDMRDLLAKIGKLLAIEEGRYELKEGESKPDLHAMYARLHAAFTNIDSSHTDEELHGLMRELDQKGTAMIEGLSVPPLAAELRAAQNRTSELNPQIEVLYKHLDDLRRHEAPTVE